MSDPNIRPSQTAPFDVVNSGMNLLEGEIKKCDGRIDKNISALGNLTQIVNAQALICERNAGQVNDRVMSDLTALAKLIADVSDHLAKAQLNITEKLLKQEQKTIQQTADMIDKRDSKLIGVVEKLERRFERNENKNNEEFGKIHSKLEQFAKNQWKMMGGLVVLGVLINFYAPTLIQTNFRPIAVTKTTQPHASGHNIKVDDLHKLINLLNEKVTAE